MKNRLLFLTLNTFSATGGIEKVCRVAGKALYDLAKEQDGNLSIYSMHDTETVDEKYFPAKIFKGFGGSKLRTIWQSVTTGIKSNFVLLSHINLLPIGWLIKMFSPNTKIVLIAHGIEMWEPLQGMKKKMLKAVDFFLPVSSFTAQKLHQVQRIEKDKIHVVNNCLDPFLERKCDVEKENYLRAKYGFGQDDFILLTLTRLKFSEQYKGYDKVVEALASFKNSHPQLKYLIVGRYDKEEKDRLDKIISDNNLTGKVVYAGFVSDEELAAHFYIADAYIMPSTGEGFGIVFIEALFYGKPVIAGNVDGSVDALGNGDFGILVNPNQIDQIQEAIVEVVKSKNLYKPNLEKVIEKFGFDTYKKGLHRILFSKPELQKNSFKTASS